MTTSSRQAVGEVPRLRIARLKGDSLVICPACGHAMSSGTCPACGEPAPVSVAAKLLTCLAVLAASALMVGGCAMYLAGT